MTDEHESEHEPEVDDERDDEAQGEVDRDTLRRRVEESLERLLPEVVKRAVDAGLGSVSRADRGRLRGLVNDLKIPKDVARYILAQVDDTKNALLRVFAREVREFLEHTDLAEDMRRVLTSVSLEISTRVRFVPAEGAAGIRPDVSAKVTATDSAARATPEDDEEEP